MAAKLMKGKKWTERKHKMTYPAWVEIKHDEIRCRVKIVDNTGRTPFVGVPEKFVEFWSYAGNPLHNMERFEAAWLEISALTGYTEFDTGFEANKNFNDSYRWVRSSKGLPPELEDVPTAFLLFDLPQLTDTPFEQRMVERHRVAVLAAEIDFNLFQPAGSWAHEEESVVKMFNVARERGFEGLMVKSLSHTYEPGKRIDGWLKVKPEDDADGIITELHEAHSEDGTPLGRVGSVTIAVEDGSTATPHGIAHDLGREMFEHPEKFIGQWAEFKYMERDRQGGYRHPTFHRIREAKA